MKAMLILLVWTIVSVPLLAMRREHFESSRIEFHPGEGRDPVRNIAVGTPIPDRHPDYRPTEHRLSVEETRTVLTLAQIESCEMDMKICPFSAEQLVDKILELGDWEDISPSDDIEVIPFELPNIRGAGRDRSFRPMSTSRKLGGFPKMRARTSTSNIPPFCVNMCKKRRTTRQYLFDCKSYLRNERIHSLSRRKKMTVECYKCRHLCSLRNVEIYI